MRESLNIDRRHSSTLVIWKTGVVAVVRRRLGQAIQNRADCYTAVRGGGQGWREPASDILTLPDQDEALSLLSKAVVGAVVERWNQDIARVKPLM
jgi:hypothetical protein